MLQLYAMLSLRCHMERSDIERMARPRRGDALIGVLRDLWVIFLGMGSTLFVVAFCEGIRVLVR